MVNNDVIRSVRFILNVGSQQILEMIALSGLKLNLTQVSDFMADETASNYLSCDDLVMAHFLDGLIYAKRGKDESRPSVPFEFPISNNLVLKKIKVAFQLKEDDLHDILKKAEYPLGRAEVSAFLRKRNHENYRECGDQVLRYFLKGLAAHEHAFKPKAP
ncbi:MAG: DUF1456 family protein [Bdellovibrionaceae bacterium]|nr:DUF1456 family protein [Pseudobdellovibrionaceae bacterium]